MTTQNIRAALETKLLSFQPLQTSKGEPAVAWENADFKPESGVPYLQVTVLFTKPENPTVGDAFYRQRGFMQVNVMWPQYRGSGDAATLADTIRRTYPRGLSLQADDVEVTVDTTPEIGSGSVQGDRYVIPVRVTFYANVFTEN